MKLASYLLDQWTNGTGGEEPLLNPATEAELNQVTTTGFDWQAALHHARSVGGPALRALSFKERGQMLRAVGRAIHEKRDELLGLAIANGGNTRSDAKFDIDGATATLAAYADLGESLGDGKVLRDGDALQLGRGARLFGQHVVLPRRGVAVHINAFNFPAWGFAEKAATAWLAGMPVLVKPAVSTGLVAFRIAELVTAAKLAPAGVFSFALAHHAGLLEALGPQDVLAFTGSSKTASLLRGHTAFTQGGARLNTEADSLNAAILGPDVDLTSELGTLFVADVVRDMTQKAGQKCTATRRIYVPKDKVAAAAELLAERLASVKVGDPARDDVTMGPVSSAQQHKSVTEGIARIEAIARKATAPSTPAVLRQGETKSGGFFVPPTLFVLESPDLTDAVHQHEVFGPVATIMPYEGDIARLAQLVAAGGGGLVASVYSDDRAWTQNLVLELGPWHGRLVLQNEKVAGQAMPPGLVLPALVHGGPGRAGGGEELGGLRGMALYMQRVALQGDRAVLDAFGKTG